MPCVSSDRRVRTFIRTLAGGLGVLLAFAAAPRPGFAGADPPAPETPYIQRILAGPSERLGIYETPESRRYWKLLREFYTARGNRPVWSDGRGGFPLAPALFSELHHAAEHGLDPEDYPAGPLQARIFEAVAWDPRRWGEIEVSLSFLFITYGSHLGRGRVDPRDLPEIEWYLPKRRVGLVHLLETATRTGDIVLSLHSTLPAHPEYDRLTSALAALRRVEARGWPRLPSRNFNAEFGDTLRDLTKIRNFLQSVGDMPPGPVRAPEVMDDLLERGVRSFQGRHGLAPDGVIGPRTLGQMRVPVAERIRTVLLNLERWRWVPDSLAVRRVTVNVPAYELEVIESGRVTMGMRIIAGAKDTPTPSFHETIRHLEINPPWHVPESIASDEILPKVQENPDYLLAENITVIDSTGAAVDPASVSWASLVPGALPYRFRQEPGAGNPLGSIKFLFPNQWSVYLHDTPNTQLFRKEYRALSHGCVRIEKPLDMAQYLLKGQTQWTPEELLEFVKSGKRRWIDIQNPLPIYIVYFTAGAVRDGTPRFWPDIYGRDDVLQEALDAYSSPWTEPPPPPPIPAPDSSGVVPDRPDSLAPPDSLRPPVEEGVRP